MSGCVAAVRQELSVADTGDDDQVPQNEEGVRKILFKPCRVEGFLSCEPGNL